MTRTNIKKVVLMANNYDAVGGITTFINIIGKGFIDAGYEVEVVTIEPTHYSAVSLIDRKLQQIAIIDSPMPVARHFKRKKDYLKPSIYKNKVLNRRRQKVINSRLAGLYGRWGNDTVVVLTQVYVAERLTAAGINLASNKGPYIVGMYHASYDESLSSGSRDFNRLKKNYQKIDHFVVLTPRDVELFRRAGMPSVSHIVNPLPEEYFKPKQHYGSKTVVSIGRYHHHKSLDYLIKAWSIVNKQAPDWKLDLYGGGPDERKLQSLVKKLKLESSVTLHGAVDRSKVLSVLSAADIHAMSSQHEGMPFAILEAAARGVPTVTFNSSPGMSLLVDDGASGYIVPKNDTEALAEKLLYIINSNRELKKMGKNAYRHAENFKLPHIIKAWQRLFEELEL